MSDIRKIQTGNNQYTLHARVSDKLAVSTQVGSPTKPVYVDSSGQVKACSREIPTGMTIDTVLNDTSVNAVQNKVINAALKGKNPKAKADFIASSDLTALPITSGVLDLNGYTLTLSKTGYISPAEIRNGTIIAQNCAITITCLNYDLTLKTTGTGDFRIYDGTCYNMDAWGPVIFASYSSAFNCVFEDTLTIDGAEEVSIINSHIEKLHFGSGVAWLLGCTSKEFTYNENAYTGLHAQSTYIGGTFYIEAYFDYQGFVETGYESSISGKPQSLNAPSTKAVTDYLQDYVKKSDISKVYKYKGTKTNYSELPTSGNTVGDVWNITNADAANHIKAGDNVVWDGSKWDNLSGTVDLSNYLQKGGKQTTTSTADGGSNVYTFKDGSTITVKNGSKGSTGAAATWFSGGAVTGTSTTAKTFTVSGSKAGDMYLNTGTSNVYRATAANQWVYLCNIKGPQGTPGNNGVTPTIKAAAGGNIGVVGTPSVTANTSGTTTTFTFNNLKGQKGDTGATVTWHTGTAVTGTAATVAGAKTGDMYLNTKTYNVYKSTGTNKWVGVCNIKGANGTTPTIKAAAGSNINSVGTPTVSATTSGATTTFTFNNLKGQKGETGATITWHSGTAVPNAGVHAVTNAKVGDMYLNTHTCDVFKAANAVQSSFDWVLVCNIKGAKGDAADIPKLAKGVAGIVPGTTDDSLNGYRWLNGGDDGTGKWKPLPTAAGGTSGMVRTCKDYTGSINRDDIHGYAHGTTPPTLQPITSGASDYRGVESDGSGRLFVNVPAYEKNINRAQNTVLAAPTTGTGTATFRKLTTSDIPWGDKLKVVTESQFYSTAPTAGVFYFVLEE